MPTQVPQAERGKIRIDAISGCIMLAEAIASNSITIENHQTEQDFYLLVATNPSMAFFFTSNCGFKGNSRDGFVYMLASEFSSPASIERMKRLRDFLLDSNIQKGSPNQMHYGQVYRYLPASLDHPQSGSNSKDADSLLRKCVN